MFRNKGKSKASTDDHQLSRRDKTLALNGLERSPSAGCVKKKDDKTTDKIDSAFVNWIGKDKLRSLANQDRFLQRLLNKKKQSVELVNEEADLHIPLRYPAFRFLIDHLEKLGAEEAVGIFRVTGNLTIIKEIVGGLEREPFFTVSFDPADHHGVNEFAGALKYYLRFAPVPLIPESHLQKFIEALRTSELILKLFALTEAVESLEEENRLMLRDLTFFLRRIVANSEKNRMDLNNLAVSFGSSVLRYDNTTQAQCDLQIMSLSCEIVTVLILYANDVFGQQQQETQEGEHTHSPGGSGRSNIRGISPGRRRARKLNLNLTTDLQDSIPSSPVFSHIVPNNQLGPQSYSADLSGEVVQVQELNTTADSTVEPIPTSSSENHNKLIVPAIVIQTRQRPIPPQRTGITPPPVPPRPPLQNTKYGHYIALNTARPDGTSRTIPSVNDI